MFSVNKLADYDIEVYPNFFLFGCMVDGALYQFTHSDVLALQQFLTWIRENGYTLCGYNSLYYDDVVVSRFMADSQVKTAYQTSVAIIENGLKPWDVDLLITSVDLMPILPGRHSLKKLGVSLKHEKLQELPFDPHTPLEPWQMEVIKQYNVNDLMITGKLREALKPELDLRAKLSMQYGIDLRSSGEAQIAEKVLLKQAGLFGKPLKTAARNRVGANPVINITQPSWWHRMPIERYPALNMVRAIGDRIFQTPLTVSNYQIPAKAFANTVFIGDRYYTMGVGGLHSIDGPGCWKPGPYEIMSDWDVASYYPSIILQEKLEPLQWSNQFLPIYEKIVKVRLEAKRRLDKVTADVLKIVINGSFGKFGDQFSALFDPEMLAHVTVYGQLGLLVLISMLTHKGHKVVSANTDGLTCISSESAEPVIREWEALTGMVMEETRYTAIYQQNVNSYIAITESGSLKTKGALIPEPDLRHSPNAQVCQKAVCAHLQNGAVIGEYIRNCRELNDFILTTQVRGDWSVTWGDEPQGKMVRFYKSSRIGLPDIVRTPLHDGVKGNRGRIPEGNNAVPVADFPETLPTDIDYEWYIDRAYEILKEIVKLKRHGGNTIAEGLCILGLSPVEVDMTNPRAQRAKSKRGDIDFTSTDWSQFAMGISTGVNEGILAEVNDSGRVTLYRVKDNYPSRTRDLIQRENGFKLVFGANVALPDNVQTPIYEAGHQSFDVYYTSSELAKVRG